MIWKKVPRWSNYEVSTCGRVRSRKTKRELAQWTHTSHGGTYLRVTLRQNGRRKNFRVHRLVALTHIGPARGREVDHIDRDTFNNAVDNLEWVTHTENQQRLAAALQEAA